MFSETDWKQWVLLWSGSAASAEAQRLPPDFLPRASVWVLNDAFERSTAEGHEEGEEEICRDKRSLRACLLLFWKAVSPAAPISCFVVCRTSSDRPLFHTWVWFRIWLKEMSVSSTELTVSQQTKLFVWVCKHYQSIWLLCSRWWRNTKKTIFKIFFLT